MQHTAAIHWPPAAAHAFCLNRTKYLVTRFVLCLLFFQQFMQTRFFQFLQMVKPIEISRLFRLPPVNNLLTMCITFARKKYVTNYGQQMKLPSVPVFLILDSYSATQRFRQDAKK